MELSFTVISNLIKELILIEIEYKYLNKFSFNKKGYLKEIFK